MGDGNIQNRNAEHECHINDESAHPRAKAAGLGLYDSISTRPCPQCLLRWCHVDKEINAPPDSTFPL